MVHPVLAAAEAAVGLQLEYQGELELLNEPRRTLLVSRGERAPTPDTPRLVAALAAVKQLVPRGETLVLGAGRSVYDAALWTCAQANGSAIVALTHSPDSETEWRTFFPARRLLVWPQTHSRSSARHRRDLLMAWLADRAYRLHVRRAGHMEKLAAVLEQRRCVVEPWPLPPPAQQPGGDPNNGRLAMTGALIQSHIAWHYLTHFTREPDGAWPGEPRVEYLRWLCSGSPYAPRNAFASLCRILQEKRFRACGRLMPDSTPMVCFTGAPPHAILKLRRWRPGLLRWSFTPYGLVLTKEALARLGAQPVSYVPRAAMSLATPAERRFMQRTHSSGADWAEEDEWRIAGDVDLSAFDPADLLALVTAPDEARTIEDTFGVRTEIIA